MQNTMLANELILAIQRGDIDQVRELVETAPELVNCDSLGDLPLVEACYSRNANNIDIARLLLEHGADVDMCDEQGCTALRWASAHRNRELVDLLFAYNAQIDDKSALSLGGLEEDEKRAKERSQNQVQTKSGCYIATACYGSNDHPDVLVLRRFRDDVLWQTVYGRLFIRAYYAISPPIAKHIGQVHWLSRLIRRWLIEPLVKKLR